MLFSFAALLLCFFEKQKIADLETNRLVIHIQPEEGISLRFGAKVPGPVVQLGLVNMEFDYARDFGRSHSTGYERLLYDCMIGDATLFQRADMVEEAWRVIQPVLDVWSSSAGPVVFQTTPQELGVRRNPTICSRGSGRAWRTIGEDHPSSEPSEGLRRRWGRQPRERVETMTTDRAVKILPDANAIAQTAAAEFLDAAQEAVREKGSFCVALAGGSTPKALYSLLATNPLLQAESTVEQKIQFFFGDERHVPPDDRESNFRMAKESMFDRAPVEPKQVHRIQAENPNAAEAAEQYEAELREYFQLKAGQFPRFDLVLLGMGPEGHVASLFPGTKAMNEERRLVVSNWVGKFFTDRIHSHTSGFEQRGPHHLFMAHGAEKALALKAVSSKGRMSRTSFLPKPFA